MFYITSKVLTRSAEQKPRPLTSTRTLVNIQSTAHAASASSDVSLLHDNRHRHRRRVPSAYFDAVNSRRISTERRACAVATASFRFTAARCGPDIVVRLLYCLQGCVMMLSTFRQRHTKDYNHLHRHGLFQIRSYYPTAKGHSDIVLMQPIRLLSHTLLSILVCHRNFQFHFVCKTQVI